MPLRFLWGRGFCPVPMGLRPTNKHENAGPALWGRASALPPGFCPASPGPVACLAVPVFKGAAGLPPGVCRTSGLQNSIDSMEFAVSKTPGGSPAAGWKACPTGWFENLSGMRRYRRPYLPAVVELARISSGSSEIAAVSAATGGTSSPSAHWFGTSRNRRSFAAEPSK